MNIFNNNFSNMQMPFQSMNPNINFMSFSNINGMMNPNNINMNMNMQAQNQNFNMNNNMMYPNLNMNFAMNQNFNMNNMMNQMHYFNMNNIMNENSNMINQNQNLNLDNFFPNINLNNPNNINNLDNIKFTNNIMGNNALNIIFSNVVNHSNYLIVAYPEERLSEIINKFRVKANNYDNELIFIFNSKLLNPSLTVSENDLRNGSIIQVISTQGLKIGGVVKKIDIEFLQNSEDYTDKISKSELVSLLKVCFLKEISTLLGEEKIKLLPEKIRTILTILLEGFKKEGNVIKNKKDEILLLKVDLDNIINFSDYIDEIIDLNELNKIVELLDNYKISEMNKIRYKLSRYNNYMKLFLTEFDKAKKESIFEFSMVSCVIIEREDFEKFEKERDKCENLEEKILYHGIKDEPKSCLLSSLLNIGKFNQKGKGVYLSDILDNCWFNKPDDNNEINELKIPQIKDTFRFITCAVYYNKKKLKRVYDHENDPKKDEINFSFEDSKFDTIIEEKPDESKFIGKEYVIGCLDQICPFMGAKLKRNEFCIIWRDINFSSKAIYHNEYDEIFKKFLKERMKYIKQVAKYNVYPCETSEEALKLLEKKKYNKIILISNVGADKAGKDFVTNARKIIGSDIITLFLAYDEGHLNWIKNYKNAIFSNEPQFYEEYLQCFDDIKEINNKLKSLIAKVETHYKVKFNFDDNFLNYPYYKESGKYSDLTFNMPKASKAKNIEEKINEAIMKKDEFDMIKKEIEKIMKKNIKDIRIIFQATKDGDTPEIFHAKCDNINNTLVLYKSEGNRRFGGFASECWNSNNKSLIDKKCFLFSLNKKKIYLPKNAHSYKLSCKEKDDPSFIYDDSYCIRLETNALKNKALRTTKNENLFGNSNFPLSEDSDFKGVCAKEYEVLEIIF